MIRSACSAIVIASLALASCAAAPHALRLEDRSAENLVRIVNPTARPVNLYITSEHGFSPVEFHPFHVRFRDRDGHPIVFHLERVDHWYTPMVYSSDIYPVGHAPSRRLTIAAGESRDFSRADLFRWLVGWRVGNPPVTGPCTAQLRLFGRAHPRAADYVEIASNWQPAPCPVPARPMRGN